MPRGPAPAWKKRKEPVTDDYIMAAVNASGGPGKHDAAGHYSEMVIRDLADREEAMEYRRSLYRCTLWLTRNNVIALSVSKAEIDKDPGRGYLLRFRVTDKVHAMNYHLNTHGSDPARWSYDPRKRAST